MGGSSNTTEDSSVILHEFITNAPKIELHAHLNGCIREATLFELAKERSVALNDQHFANTQTVDQDRSMYNVRPRSLQDCFDMFAEIPKCVDDLDALARITTEALEDFALHHVVYLELRSTPKQLLVKTGQHAKIVSKQTYCLTILNCMKDFEHQEQERFHSEFDSGLSKCRLPMTCRFIVSVDRSQSAEVAIEHIELAASLRREYGDYVVGVDLGGNPTKNHFNHFLTAFERARLLNLNITLHCGEVLCHDENDESTKICYEEVKSILTFGPDRLGHALLLPPSLQRLLSEKKIPVESCPTSNVMTLELAKSCSGSLLEGLKQHPQLQNWIKSKHPISIGTDDPGVFDTNPTKELLLLHHAFSISREGINRILLESMDHAFCDSTTKERMKLCIQERLG